MSYYSMARPEILKLVPMHIKSLLDVGCSEGLFANSVKEKTGSLIWGIEPVSQAAEKAQTILDKVFNSFFEEAFIQIDRKFDLITFNDVLEHMIDPYTVLKQAKTLLNKDGMIIASLPNILHYHGFLNLLRTKDFRYEEAGIFDKTHLRWFTKKSILRMFDEAGYKNIQIGGLDPTPSKKMTLISLLSLGYYSEMRYPQFSVVAYV